MGQADPARRSDHLPDPGEGRPPRSGAISPRLAAEGRSIVEIAKDGLKTPADLRRAQAATLEAMRRGIDVIFQATFFDGRWRGHADFLFKRSDRPSPVLGAWSYDIADTKLAAVGEGRRDPPDVRLRRPARGPAGDRPGMAARHHRRSGRSTPTGPTTSRPTSGSCRRRFDERMSLVWLTARRHLPRPGRPLPRVRLVPDVHPAPSRRRPPVDRRGHASARHGTSDRRHGISTLAGLAVLSPGQPVDGIGGLRS